MRLLGASVLVAVCSIGATAWLAVTSTSHAIEQQQEQSLSADTDIYNTLLGYAAAHPNWNTVGPTLASLAASTGRRVTLTTTARQPIADSARAEFSPLPSNASAVVDPLSMDTALASASVSTRIDPQVVGPYQLTAEERTTLDQTATTIIKCLQGYGQTAQVVTAPNGRPSIAADDAYSIELLSTHCSTSTLDDATPTEASALDQLDALVDACLNRQAIPIVVRLDLHYGWSSKKIVTSQGGTGTKSPGAEPADHTQSIESCIYSGRQQQLAPYVAPAALLFITSTSGAPASHFDLSGTNTRRIAEVAALVLAVTIAVTALVGARLIAPLRALTEAARNPTEPHARVPVTGSDEIGNLAAALNDLSERRERIEEQREAMVSDVAHELRTPLSNIRGWLEAVEDGVADADPELVSALLQEALLLQHIIDDLRDLAAADADTFRLHLETVRVRDVIGQVVAAHREGAHAAGVALRTWTDGDPELSADPIRLRQAVGNLVSNAIRHTPRGGAVSVSASCLTEELVIEVRDTGGGIGSEDLPRVFDRFWRAEKSRSRHTGGSGLGLAIVRQLTEAHGGTVTAESTIGAGSTFTLRLPASPRA